MRGSTVHEINMPTQIQELGMDRPGIPLLPPEQLELLGRHIEPMGAPAEIVGVGWAVQSLHACLTHFRDASNIKPKAAFASILARSEVASSLLSESVQPPMVVVEREVTLWTCLVALDPTNADPKLCKSLGAVYFLLFNGYSHPTQPVMKVLLQAALTTRESNAALNASRSTAAAIAAADLYTKALAALQGAPASLRSAASSMVEAKVEKALAGAYRFVDHAKLDLRVASRGLTPNDVMDTAKAARAAAEAGSGRMLLAALAHWHGVLPADFVRMELFSASAGLMRMDSTSSYTRVRLTGILTELAQTELAGVVIAGDSLYLPMPLWLSVLLRALRLAAPQALSLADLPGIPTAPRELRRLLHEAGLPGRVTANKFVVDRAMALVNVTDPICMALASIDWSRVEKVANAYQHITHAEFLKVVALRAERLVWGELAASPVPAHGYLSKVTPELATIVALGKRLSAELDEAYPGPNAGVDLLLLHHDAFLRYTAFLLAVALLLRGQEQTLIPASSLLLAAIDGFNDKGLPSAKAQPATLVFGPTLRHQLRYLAAHYRAIAKRLEERTAACPAWIPSAVAEFRKVVDGAADRALLLRVVKTKIAVFTHLDLVAYLGTDWAGKADALRHKGPDLLRAAGVDYTAREAMLRHIAGARPITSPTSAWSGNDWYDEASRYQELLFEAFELQAQGGLIKSLPRTA